MGPTGCVTLYISYTKHTGRGQHVKYLLFLLITCSCSFFFAMPPTILAFFKRASQRPAHTQSFRKLHILQLR